MKVSELVKILDSIPGDYEVEVNQAVIKSIVAYSDGERGVVTLGKVDTGTVHFALRANTKNIMIEDMLPQILNVVSFNKYANDFCGIVGIPKDSFAIKVITMDAVTKLASRLARAEISNKHHPRSDDIRALLSKFIGSAKRTGGNAKF